MSTDHSLSKITVRPVFQEEKARWQRMMEEKHYLQSNRMVGEQIRYVAVAEDGRWLACLGWSSACRHLSGREQWLGWSEGQRAMRLHLVVNNARFLMLGKRGETRNLASQVLSHNLDRLSADWEERYGHPALVAETFVDLQRRRADGSIEAISEREAGACYRAVGFDACGQTRGFRRIRGGFTRHGQRRLLLTREVVRGARALLTNQSTQWDREERAAPVNRVDLLALPSAFDPERGLIAHMTKHVPDPRQVRQYSWSCILIGLLGGVLAGRQTMKDIAGWAKALPEETIKRIGGRWKKGTYRMPVANTYGYALEHADLTQVNVALRSWIEGQGITWQGDVIAIDGKILIGASRTGAARATASAFSVARRAVIALESYTGDERKASSACLRQLALRGCTVTGDSLYAIAAFVDSDIGKKGLPTSSSSKRISPNYSTWLRNSTGRAPQQSTANIPAEIMATDVTKIALSAAST